MEKNAAPSRFSKISSVPFPWCTSKSKNGDALNAGRERFERGDGNIIQVTKTHNAITGGVMAGRAHQAQNGFAASRATHRFQGRAGRGARIACDARMRRRVRVEIFRIAQAGQKFRVCARRMAASSAAAALAQTIGSSVCARSFSTVLMMRAGFSGWPGLEYPVQASSVIIFIFQSAALCSVTIILPFVETTLTRKVLLP